ncbi:MAG TPA: CHASE3 domain-containing protein, partial [Micromonosporaceae bacterium]|nr:CHASE3 domain-containing protein [Micromonosporaceae bacterium]
MTALTAVVVAALLGLAVGGTVLAASNRNNLDELVTSINPSRTAAERLLSALVDQETGVRGYALTGDRAYLRPYEEGLAREADLIAELRAVLPDAPALHNDVDAIEVEAEGWRAEVATPIIAAVATQGPTAGRELATDAARQRFDRVRDAVRALQDDLRALRDDIAAKARRTGDRLVLLLLGAAVVVLFAGVALTLLLRRMVARPVTELAAQVRKVAGGDFDHEITTSGPPEVARLAADVDAMRRRIAADLAEVREARGQVQWVNDQLRVQAEELTRSNRDLEQFAYVASHDLQEPLRKVASFCQLLQRRYAGQLDERADQYIAFAVDGAQRMQRLINDLLAFSRIGRLTAGFTDVDLNTLMSDVASQTEAAREYARGQITWDRLPVVEGEEPLLTTLFTNLVSNSLKFRRPDVPPRIHISAVRRGADWELAVADNGIGIEREFADKVFVIFQRLHAKDAYPGTGIGLAIVKKIIEYHGGRVWLDPDVVEGTTVRFTLPSAPTAGEHES